MLAFVSGLADCRTPYGVDAYSAGLDVELSRKRRELEDKSMKKSMKLKIPDNCTEVNTYYV